MADARNPCLKCDNFELDKNNNTCTECDLRINYVKSLGYFTESELKRIDAPKPLPNIPDAPEIDSLLKKLRESKIRKLVTFCKNEDCNKTKIFAMGLCKTHYLKNLAKRKTDGTYNVSLSHTLNRRCKIEGCNEKHHGLGYCESHYKKKFFISLQINRKIFIKAMDIVPSEYKKLGNNKKIENILKLFVKQNGNGKP